MERRVVVTGMGCVTPIGNNVEDFFNGLLEKKNGIDFITKYDTTESKAKLAAELKDFVPDEVLDKRDLRRMDNFSIYGISASAEAIKDSGINLDEYDRDRIGVIVGSGIGGLQTMEDTITTMITKGEKRVSPTFIPTCIVNMVAGNISLKFGLNGISQTVVTACASGTNTIGDAYRQIKHGYQDVILAGGSEASITRAGMAGFANLTAHTTTEDKNRASIPFDKERSGFVMGEGAGIVVLESLDSALARGAKIYAEIVGYGSTCDAYHITSPNPEAVKTAKAVGNALKEAGIKPEDVQYVNAHGTSTKINDEVETKTYKNAFGDHAKNLKISSIKSSIGHLLGAAGGVEAIATIKAIKTGIVPPTINLQVPDEDCDLDYVANEPQKVDITHAISTSLGFGGHNAVICIKKWVEN